MHTYDIPVIKNGTTQIRTGVLRTRILYAAPTPWNLYMTAFLFTLLCFFCYFDLKKKGTIGFEPMTTGTAVLCSTAELCALLFPCCAFPSAPSTLLYLFLYFTVNDNVAEWSKACD